MFPHKYCMASDFYFAFAYFLVMDVNAENEWLFPQYACNTVSDSGKMESKASTDWKNHYKSHIVETYDGYVKEFVISNEKLKESNVLSLNKNLVSHSGKKK